MLKQFPQTGVLPPEQTTSGVLHHEVSQALSAARLSKPAMLALIQHCSMVWLSKSSDLDGSAAQHCEANTSTRRSGTCVSNKKSLHVVPQAVRPAQHHSMPHLDAQQHSYLQGCCHIAEEAHMQSLHPECHPTSLTIAVPWYRL